MNTICKLLIISFFSLYINSTNAQKYTVQKVTVQDLEQKQHPKDTAAAAAVLFKIGQVSFNYSQQNGFKIVTKVKTRIKIYKKEGYDWANASQRYSIATDPKETVYYTDAYTYNLADGKVVKTKLKSDGEFDENINKYWSSKKITMPNVKEGSIIEYEYTLSTPNWGTLEDWDFQTGIPVDYSEFVTAVPEYFTYKASQKGYMLPKTTVEKKDNYIILNSKERSSGGRTVEANFSSEKIPFTETWTTYTAKDVPAMKDEAFVNNIRNYSSSVSHEISMTRFPGSVDKYYSLDWEAVTKNIYDNENFGAELNKSGYFENDIDALLAGISDPAQKAALIFNHVKAIKWNDYVGYYCNDGVRKAYKDKTGNVAEINLMLTSMLRYAGLNANPVLLSTRSNGIALFPNRAAYNYVIAAVELNGATVLLDATEKFSGPNTLPLRDLNWTGRMLRKDGTSSEIDLMPKGISKEAINIFYKVDAAGSVTGKFRKQLTDHMALGFRQKNIGTKQDNYLETLENTNDKIEINDYVRENESDLSKPIIESYSFVANNNVELIGGKMYIAPLLFLADPTNPFKQDKREYPIDFGYPSEYKYNLNIEIPEGYAVESLPQPITIATEEKIGNFKYIIAQSGNKIQVSVTSNLNWAIVPAEYYMTIKDFFQKMADKENEKIVLKKV